ncbi:hypothetical protein SLS62_010263 [Diatrype stigma]|uniref:DUF7730 domain-containing protein n=1 Tax=Diatrype stigma TaxID=117547 RepID=A0AAN9YJ51_9PEZI
MPSPPSSPSLTTAPAPTPDRDALRATADLQLGSSFFGRLPLEIREIIYSEFWIVSGLKQHIFRRDDGRLTHCPCLLADGKGHGGGGGGGGYDDGDDDKRDNEFAEVWQNRLFTDFATAHHTLVASPTSTVPLLRSLQFSLVIPYDTLHQHHYYHTDTHPSTTNDNTAMPLTGPGPWAELCTTLSNLVRFDSLRRVALRLDLADNRYWWEVRERWVFSAIRGLLARRLTVQLPEIENAAASASTAAASGEEDWRGPYQYRKGDKTPFLKLERYPRLRWTGTGMGMGMGVRMYEGQRVNVSRSRLEFLRPADRQIIVRDMRETRLGKAKKSLKDLVSGLKGM